MSREKKKQEQIDLAPARSLQPKSRSIRYDNMKSAMAEEGVIARCLREPALLDQCRHLKPQAFSVPLLGKVYGQLQRRHEQGLEVSVAGLEELSPEEMSHIASIAHRQQEPVNEQAFGDCVRTILAEHQAASVETEADILAFQERLKQRKGIKG